MRVVPMPRFDLPTDILAASNVLMLEKSPLYPPQTPSRAALVATV